MLGTIAVLSFLGNGTLCGVILRNRAMLQQAHNVLVFTLAVTDMLTGLSSLTGPSAIRCYPYTDRLTFVTADIQTG